MRLSILIRNLNEAKFLQQTLHSLNRQKCGYQYEVIVVDNESTDNSVEVAEAMGCKVYNLKRANFTFGRALNYGIGKCSGEIILIMSAHLILLNEFFLQDIPDYFNDPNVAGLRFTETSAAENVIATFETGVKRLLLSNDKAFLQKNWKNLIVNHCAAIRKSCWERLPFNEEIFASEDKIWSIEVLNKGYTILYNIPGFYVYAKPFHPDTRLKRQIIEVAAKELITGEREGLYARPIAASLVKKIISGLSRLLLDVKNHFEIYKGLRKYRRLYLEKQAMSSGETVPGTKYSDYA